MNCSVLKRVLSSCLTAPAQYGVFRFHLKEQLRMKCIFSGVLYFSTTAAVWTYFPTPNKDLWSCVIPAGVLSAHWHDRENCWWKQLDCARERKVFFFLFFCSFFSLLYHCFKINFRSDLQKLRYQKHMYFRYCLGRVRQFLFVHFHWGKQFPQNKTCECTDYHWMWSFPSSA